MDSPVLSPQGYLCAQCVITKLVSFFFLQIMDGYQIAADYCGSVGLLWQWGQQTDKYWQVPWLVAAVRLTGSNWQLPANVEWTSGHSESGASGPIRGRYGRETGQWEAEAGLCQYWHNLGYSERGRVGTQPNSKADEGRLLSSTHFQIKSSRCSLFNQIHLWNIFI